MSFVEPLTAPRRSNYGLERAGDDALLVDQLSSISSRTRSSFELPSRFSTTSSATVTWSPSNLSGPPVVKA